MTKVANDNKIARLNDLFRKSFVGGKIIVTQGIQALPELDQRKILEKVQNIDAFTEDNDPYGEHDFGTFDHNCSKIFWKIDYYDLNLEYHSPDPADVTQTKRVLAVMLAKEY